MGMKTTEHPTLNIQHSTSNEGRGKERNRILVGQGIVGLDIRDGNTQQINYTTSAYAKRRTSATRFYIDYLGIFNNTEGIETASSQRIGSYYDRFIKRNSF